jgi:hypothetical protein
MKSKDGAVIIGFRHSGIKKAKEIIQQLEKNGIKENDLIAVEYNQTELRRLLDKWNKIKITDDLALFSEEEMFYVRLFKFLQQKKARIMHLESSRHLGLRSRYLYDYLENLNLKSLKMFRLMTVPIREKFWAKKLKGKKPAFVLAGAGHIPAIKKMIPYRKILNLNRIGSLIVRPITAYLRFSYNKAKQKSRKRREELMKTRKKMH